MNNSVASSTSSSSRSSSRASSTPSFLKNEERLSPVLSAEKIKEIKDEVLKIVMENIKPDMDQIVSEFRVKCRRYADHEKLSDIEKERNAFSELSLIQEELKRSYQEDNIIENTKIEQRYNAKEQLQDGQIYSDEWLDKAVDYVENKTEKIESELWGEMGSTLQNIYRVYRNTASRIKLDKQITLDTSENRLNSLLIQAESNNLARVSYLTNDTTSYLKQNVTETENDMKMEIKLECDTMRREIAQIKFDAEYCRTQNDNNYCSIM